MAITINRTTSLDGAILPEYMPGLLYMNENQAHQFVITCTRGGSAVTLTGGITGRFMRADGQTILLSGSISSGKANLTLPQSCYIVPGRFTMAIFNVVGNAVTTIYAITGNVARTQTDTLVDPGNTVPTIDNLLAEIDAMRQATADANAAATKAVRYDTTQSLTDANKTTARGNIDAAGLAQVVRHDASQNLTETQKTTARGNIDAAGLAQVVRHDASQDLTETQKTTARGNIDAAGLAQVADLESAINHTIGTILYEGIKAYSGGAENWSTIRLTENKKLGIKLNNSTNRQLEVSANVGGRWLILELIEDSAWHIVDIPSNVSNYLLITYRGSEPFTVSGIICEISEGDIASLVGDIASLKGDIASLEGQQIVEDVTYPYSGFINTSGNVVSNDDFFYSDFIPTQDLKLEVDIYWHSDVATFTFYDANKAYINKYVKWSSDSTYGMEKRNIEIPEDAIYVKVCTDPTYPNKVYIYKTRDVLTDLRNKINGNKLSYGNTGHTSVDFMFDTNFSACPCKKAEKSGKVESIYVNSYGAGTTEIFVGEVDQLYLFVPRTSFSIELEAGANIYDVTDKDIYINEGEQILIRFIGGKTGFKRLPGSPEDDNSFYYNNQGNMQLQVFGAQNAAVFGFAYTVASSTINEQGAQIDRNSDNIDVLTENVSALQAGVNVITDRSGNKYKMIVQNGTIVLLPMNFHHVLCVGNSYTTHPTVDDTETDYRNNLWWGHWAMAASSVDTAWTHLLQTALRQKVSDAKVTSVFGRRYETAYSTYTLDNPNTFTYWDGTAWRSLANDLASFADVDAIIFFLGANYSGNDWYTLYSAMVSKFLTWFPNATLFCCSSSNGNNAARDGAIQQVANEQSATYISMVGNYNSAKLGAYVYGDDGSLHQINNTAVANHFGDYGEYVIHDRICSAMGYTNNTLLRSITIIAVSGVSLTVKSNKTIAGSVISVFAEVTDGITLSSITVTDSGSNTITVTDHGVTNYGRIFTFEMPESDVTIVGNVA